MLGMTQIPKCCFIYGCVASLGALIWFLAAITGHPVLPSSVWVAEAFLVTHAIVMVVTFHWRLQRPWAPIFQVTRPRIRFAKLLLLVGAVNCLLCFALVVYQARGVSE